ncbi:protein Skeletor, isoforms B/C [Eurytemora carolleeae]|uniref:protein Skeletor, isoforms B/C n=1 Tax=Eurytemora carolleeae TaxID=1294199 RepID=UPI000C75C0A5|nr:protein Skeletor, isoforms B/C [Eurytemora carolleeae]|eukprot:XP_023321495.1 protein Skeletor, isoforms B/C-like [Eurytemora affinis]
MKTFVALLALSSVVSAKITQKYIGKLSTLQHDVSGDVYAKDENTLVIENFKYDGAGPDAFFWVGKTGTPAATDTAMTLILAHPYEGNNYEYTNEAAPVLRQYTGEMVELTLPQSFKVSDVKWLSIWCRKFSVDFGNTMFPEDLVFDDEDDVPSPLAPEDDEHSQDWNHVDNHVDPQAEPEPDSEPEPYSASSVLSLALPTLLVALLAKLM